MLKCLKNLKIIFKNISISAFHYVGKKRVRIAFKNKSNPENPYFGQYGTLLEGIKFNCLLFTNYYITVDVYLIFYSLNQWFQTSLIV